uniref:Ionotropic glutamate receptor C-terminal domain-containing protein n=1 Tax=Timema poppense TaxID=170557 RepID=A0A7R9H6T8_TIMPO|nr:unnamed protein product [Timema poppensis]
MFLILLLQDLPKRCLIPREFTLKESFWFALTSFTPQGGGEAPKALSGRTLVAAYWLFVVLMLATFTANLAAFLTVERMKVSHSLIHEMLMEKLGHTELCGIWLPKILTEAHKQKHMESTDDETCI